MRLIDVDAFKAKLAEEEITFPMLDFAPTVDAVPVEDHKIIVEKARREAYHSGYKQGRFDEFIEAQYGRGDYDIVPVIRCKDCKWFDIGENPDDAWCTCIERSTYFETHAEDYCSMAERKEVSIKVTPGDVTLDVTLK